MWITADGIQLNCWLINWKINVRKSRIWHQVLQRKRYEIQREPHRSSNVYLIRVPEGENERDYIWSNSSQNGMFSNWKHKALGLKDLWKQDLYTYTNR